jgi:hypothetical protein
MLAATGAGRQGRARSVIYLNQFGGPSHLDTIDPKPDSPDGIRGEFQPIATRVPGLQLCDHLPRLARAADKFTVIRSLYHEMTSHNSAGYYSLTGQSPLRNELLLPDSLERSPAYGSVVDRFAPAKNGMPTFVAYPHVLRDGWVTPGQHASFLGRIHNPFFFTTDPNSPDFRLPELSLPADVSLDDLDNRRTLLQTLDNQVKRFESTAQAKGVDASRERAFALLTSPRVKRAFDLSAEPAALRDRYGRTTYGQGCLLARRLVEAGVRFVNVYFSGRIGGANGGWDTHADRNNPPMYPVLKQHLLPQTDLAVPALLEDLDARGLLDETLVVWMGEFGRTPKINEGGGRDHWPNCYPALLAGGGVRRGFVYGASDKQGAYPNDRPVRPEDLAATMFSLLGIDPHTEVIDIQGKPMPIAQGKPITGLLA